MDNVVFLTKGPSDDGDWLDPVQEEAESAGGVRLVLH